MSTMSQRKKGDKRRDDRGGVSIHLAAGQLVWLKLHADGGQLGPPLESYCLHLKFVGSAEKACCGVVVRGNGESSDPHDGVCAVLTAKSTDRSLACVGRDLCSKRTRLALPGRAQSLTDWEVVVDGPVGTATIDGVELPFACGRPHGHIAFFNASEEPCEVIHVTLRNVNKRRTWDIMKDAPIPQKGEELIGPELSSGPAFEHVLRSTAGDYVGSRPVLHSAHRLELYAKSKPGRLFVPAYRKLMRDKSKAKGVPPRSPDWSISGWYERERDLGPTTDPEIRKLAPLGDLTPMSPKSTTDTSPKKDKRAKVKLARETEFMQAWNHFEDDGVLNRPDIPPFLAYLNGYRPPSWALIDDVLDDCFPREFDPDPISSLNLDETRAFTARFLELEKVQLCANLLNVEIDEQLFFDNNPVIGREVPPKDANLYRTEGPDGIDEISVQRDDIPYSCAMMGAPGISTDLVQEILRAVPCKDDRITIDELYDIFLHARASESFTKMETAFFLSVFHKFDADMSGLLDMEEYEKVLQYLGYSADKAILDEIKGEVTFKNGEELDAREFIKAMRVYRVVEVRNFKYLFKKHDDDGSGDLSIEELDPLIREIGYIPTQAMLRELCRHFAGPDVPEAELSVNSETFVRFMRLFQANEGFTQKEAQQFRDTFSTINVLQTGELSTLELTTFLRHCGFAAAATDVQAKCDHIDVAETGLFDINEAMKIVRMTRNGEMARAEKLLKPLREDGTDAVSLIEFSELITELGYEASYKRVKLFAGAKEESHTLTWFELQTVFDRVRKDEQVCQRERIGFSKEMTDLYMRGFKTYGQPLPPGTPGADGNPLLAAEDVMSLLKLIGCAPTGPDLPFLTALLEKKGKMTFPEYLQMMRRFFDEVQLNKRKKEIFAATKCNFDEEEVTLFREIYQTRASDWAHDEFTLSDLAAMLIALGMGGLQNEKGPMRKQLQETFDSCDQDKKQRLEFSEFMLLMKKLVDVDFGHIIRLTGMYSLQKSEPREEEGEEKGAEAEVDDGEERQPMLAGKLMRRLSTARLLGEEGDEGGEEKGAHEDDGAEEPDNVELEQEEPGNPDVRVGETEENVRRQSAAELAEEVLEQAEGRAEEAIVDAAELVESPK